MAIKKVRIRPKVAGGGYDILHPETERSMITDFPVTVGNANLLDNSKFPYAVNQRGKDTYTDSYCIDRWILSAATASVYNEGITITPTTEDYGMFYQNLSLLETGISVGDTLTLQTEVGGKVYSAVTTANPAEGAGSATPGIEESWGCVRIYCINELLRVAFRFNTAISPKWIKLERGSVATPYVPKGYNNELIECMRYYRRIPEWTHVGSGYIEWDGSLMSIQIPTPGKMRANPTINPLATAVYANGTFLTVTGIPNYAVAQTGTVMICFTNKIPNVNLENFKNCPVTMRTSENPLELSADI